jgi:hypothetical protein
MLCVLIFIAVLDVLKYCFGIDLAKNKLKQKKYKKQRKKNKPGIPVRYIYVHAPPKQSSENRIS